MLNEYIPDPIELGEARVERYLDEHCQNGLMQCSICRHWFPIDGGWHPSSSDPYSLPICEGCCEDMN
jgi:hypothetical protein